MSQLSE